MTNDKIANELFESVLSNFEAILEVAELEHPTRDVRAMSIFVSLMLITGGAFEVFRNRTEIVPNLSANLHAKAKRYWFENTHKFEELPRSEDLIDALLSTHERAFAPVVFTLVQKAMREDQEGFTKAFDDLVTKCLTGRDGKCDYQTYQIVAIKGLITESFKNAKKFSKEV